MPAAPTKPATPPSPPPRRPPVELEMSPGEAQDISRFNRVKKLINLQTYIITAFGFLLLFAIPFAQPIYVYYAMTPDNKIERLVGLDGPNMTNRAVIAWSTTSITEIMTMGFGDFDVKIPKQRWRFTPNGWDAYVKAFVREQIGDTFKKNQLVLTTVPSNTPVIISQGINADNRYQWVVQMPVIMTYATNNDVTSQKRTIITLVIVRVSAEESPAGIAIESWYSPS